VFRAVDTLYYKDLIFDEIIKLLRDEEVEIQGEAAALLLHTVDIFPHDFLLEHVLPVVRSTILNANALPVVVRRIIEILPLLV
jgi:hypothetical protein